MSSNRVALIIAGVLLLLVGGVVLRGTSVPAIAPPVPLPTAEAPSSKPAPRAPAVASAPPRAEPDREVDGVQIAVLQEGEGPVASDGDRVLLHFTTWLMDGKRVSSTQQKGRPVGVKLGDGALLPGLESTVRGMKAGERRKAVIPPEKAFGAQGRGPIPPNSSVIVEVVLLEIG